MNNPGYLLTSGPELERLRLQAKMWEPEAERCLDLVGIREGWHCIDLGCGAQGILEPLSRRVGAEGKVVGADRDPLQLESARALVRERALANVVIKDADAYATGFAPGLFDLAHVRFLFAPVGRDPELLRHMLELVRPGGVLMAQEPDAVSWECRPGLAAWTMLTGAILEAFRRGGGDFNAGRRLHAMWRQSGLKDIQIRSAVLTLPGTHPYAALPIQFAASLRTRILDGCILAEKDLDQAIAACKTGLSEEGRVVTTFIVHQVWGRKALS